MTAVFPAPFPAAAQPASADLLGMAEASICFAILLLMSSALLAPLFAPDQNADAVPWLRLIWLPVYAAVAALMLLRPLRLTRVAVPAAMSLALVGWALASMRWSIDPDLTLRRAVALFFTTCFGLYLAARYDWRDLIRLVAGAYLVLAVGSYVASLLFPGFGVHATIHPGAWRGLWYEKNMLGAAMAVGTLACACAAIVSRGERRVWIVGAGLCAGLVIASTSTTSLLALLIIGAGLAGLALLRRGGAVAVATGWAGVVCAGLVLVVLLVVPEQFFSLVGKDATLTGRTGIWEALLRRVAERPLLGYGFGAFWQDPLGPSWFIRSEVQWAAPNAHNGWLDVLVQLGWVGLGLALTHFAVALMATAARWRGGPETYWASLYMVLFTLFSVSESTVMQYNGISWVLYVATMAKLMQWRGLASGPVARPPAAALFPEEEPEEIWRIAPDPRRSPSR